MQAFSCLILNKKSMVPLRMQILHYVQYNHEQNKENKEFFVINCFFPPNKVDFPTNTFITEYDTFYLQNKTLVQSTSITYICPHISNS